MANLVDKAAALFTKLVGANSSGVETNPVNATANGDLYTSDGVSTGGTQGNLSVGTSAVRAKVGSSPLALCKLLSLQPIDGDMYWGYTSSVTTSTGTLIKKGQTFWWELKPDAPAEIWVISANAGKSARVTEAP